MYPAKGTPEWERIQFSEMDTHELQAYLRILQFSKRCIRSQDAIDTQARHEQMVKETLDARMGVAT